MNQVRRRQRKALLDWRRARPVLLCNGIGPCRAWLLEHEPGLRELVSLDPEDLHACASTRLAGQISELERKPEPRAVAFE